MGRLGNLLKNLVGKEEEKKYKAPDVKFMDDTGFAGVTHTIPIEIEANKHLYIIKHDGEYMVFNSLDKMPDELKEKIEHIDESDEFHHSFHVFVNGERKTYQSLDEMPEDIRDAILKNQ